jgi:LacI family sucrose operon transcriptional repressor
MVDGIFTSDDIMAAELLRVCMEKGIKVPEELKIVGFDDAGATGLLYPAITTIRQPISTMAKEAVSRICELAEKKNVSKRTVIPVELIIRETT